MFTALIFTDKRNEQFGHLRINIPLLYTVTTDETVYLTVV